MSRRSRRNRKNTAAGNECVASSGGSADKGRHNAGGILEGLGIFGAERIEPVILAAVVSTEPLLLIGPHGTGKSYLLNRICEAIGLEWRHYNASLLNYDDLVGYPVPDDSGALRYVQTPSSIWGAGAVFIDEISRCRPDIQNKLFPIIHERRVQGILLEELVYRWSAMNPPATGDGVEDEQPEYLGSEPLDPALADRFAFVVRVPDWEDLTSEHQDALLRNADLPLSAASIENFRRALSQARALRRLVEQELADRLPAYVRLVTALLARGGFRISPRRAAIIQRNIVAVHSVRLERFGETDLADSAYLAVEHSLPHAATGIRVDPIKVLAAHREAWSAAALRPDDPKRYLILERDPVKRVVRAITQQSLSREEFSGVVADALIDLPPGGRHALATEVFESDAAGRLVAAVAEQCGRDYGIVASPQNVHESVKSRSGRHLAWQRVEEILAEIFHRDADAVLETNLLTGLFACGELPTGDDVDQVFASWREVRARLKGVAA